MVRLLSSTKVAFLALVMSVLALQTAPADAASGRVYIEVTKASFVFGGTGGSGTLRYRGKTYRLSVGGVKVGFTIGVATAKLVGRASNLRRARDIEGTYVSATGSAALGKGAASVLLENERGVQLRLSGTQKGLEASLDVGGMTIQIR